MIDESGKDLLLSTAPPDFRNEIRPEKLNSIPKEQLPFSSLVKALDKGNHLRRNQQLGRQK